MSTLGRNRELDRIKKDLRDYRCEFDSWISEKEIYRSGMVEEVVKKMDEMGLLYEEDGAERAVADYISGMSDRFAVNAFMSLTVPRSWDVM